MKIQESAENYLETILIIKERNGEVRSVDIVNELNFSKPSVSVAMKNLRENGYIVMNRDGLITLTEKGMEIASRTLDRHHVLTEFFKSLGVDGKTAEADACKIEHVISEESFEAIKKHVKDNQNNR